VSGIDEIMSELIASSAMIGENHLVAVDILFKLETAIGHKNFTRRFFRKTHVIFARNDVEEWINRKRIILSNNRISLSVLDFVELTLPSARELQRLHWISGKNFSLSPDLFGGALTDVAISKFSEGKVKECSEVFEQMISDRDAAQIRNNLAFCQLILNRPYDALSNANTAVSMEYDPLYELNKGIAEFLLEDRSSAAQTLRHAIQWIDSPKNRFLDDVLYTLLLVPSERRVSYFADVPVRASILMNLWLVGEMPEAELLERLQKDYPDRYTSWLSLIGLVLT
jgi:hypothetical protein